jgi:PIN domain nuclease of toxin-antitoxin system
MSGVLLDTNTLSYYVDPSAPFRLAVSTRINQSPHKLHMSVLSTYELAMYDRIRGVSAPWFATLLSAVDIVAAPTSAAGIFADLKIAIAWR